MGEAPLYSAQEFLAEGDPALLRLLQDYGDPAPAWRVACVQA
jgi:hypothetical protein